MKIAIEVSMVRQDRLSGIERTIIETLKQVDFDEIEGKVYLLCSYGTEQIFNKCNINKSKVGILYSPFNSRLITEQIWIPYILKKLGIELVHFTTLGPTIFYRGIYTLLVHDAVPWKFSNTLSRAMKYYYKPLLTLAMKSKRLAKIITDSESSKNDFQSIFKLDSERIVVSHLGASSNFSNQNNLEDNYILSKYQLPQNYIISIGTLEPRKNIGRLISAFKIVKEKYQRDLALVFVGRKGWINDLNVPETLKEYVILTGFIEDIDLPAVLSHSKAFVMPSIYEGFGLPLLEAMVCGVPCLSSNTSSLPEVGGEAVMYFDPTDEKEIAQKILLLLNNEDIQRNLSALGKARSERFSWNESAMKLVEVLNHEIKNK